MLNLELELLRVSKKEKCYYPYDFWNDARYWSGCPWNERRIEYFEIWQTRLNKLLNHLGFCSIQVQPDREYITYKFFQDLAKAIRRSLSDGSDTDEWTDTLINLVTMLYYQYDNFGFGFGKIGKLYEETIKQAKESPVIKNYADKQRLTLKIKKTLFDYENRGKPGPKKIFGIAYIDLIETGI